MTTALHRDPQIVLSREPYRRHNVGGSHAARDQRWSVIDHAVKEPARLVITAVASQQYRPSQAGGKFPHRSFIEGRLATRAGGHLQRSHYCAPDIYLTAIR